MQWSIFLLKDQLAIQGRAKIAQEQLIQLTAIDTKRKATLKQLDIQYASADKAKSSLGYMAIISLSILFGTIFLNDFLKLCIHLYGKTRRYLRQRRLEKEEIKKSEREKNNIQIQIEMNRVYAQDLEERLERFHAALIRARIEHEN